MPTSAGHQAVWPSVEIVVLTWNGLADTERCLDSLERLSYPGHRQILVVDNASDDGSPTTLRSHFPGITLLENRRNLGYAGGNNVGLRHALDQGVDYVWLLNNDTTVDPESLTCLVEAAERDPGIGALSPVIYDSAPPGRLQYCGTFLDQGTHRRFSARSLEEAERSAQDHLLLLWGTALFLRRALIEAIGFFDERYFAYVEDLDYSLRAIHAGWKTGVVGGARIVHARSQTLGQNSPLRQYLATRNEYLLWRSHLGRRWKRREMAQLVAQDLAKAKALEDAGWDELANACRDGAWEGFRGHFGDIRQKARMPRLVRRAIAWHPYLWIGLLERRYADIGHEIWARIRRKIIA
jgi:GT2 family glycosyltransferase